MLRPVRSMALLVLLFSVLPVLSAGADDDEGTYRSRVGALSTQNQSVAQVQASTERVLTGSQAQPQSGAMPISALDPALKQQVPPLTYGAHNFSSDPAKRAVVLNGRELHEGSEIAPGVLLVAIAQDYIILQVGGQHVSLKALQDWRG